MCTGLEIAALVAAVGGTGAAAAGQSAQKKGNAYAQNQQTQLSAGEFNARDVLAKQIFAENTDINRQVYDDLNALDDQAFAERTGLSKQAFNQLGEIDKQQIVRDAAASDSNVNATRDIRIERDATRDDAKTQYEKTLTDANTRQGGYRQKADDIAASLIAAFTPQAMAGRQTSAAADRDALVSKTVTQPTGPAVAGNVDPVLAQAFARYSAAGRGAASDRAAATSKVASYSDALGAGDRTINKGDEDVAMIADEARRALTPLGAQLDTQSLRYNNAASGARAKGTAADADLEAALNLSSTRAKGEGRGVTAYTGAADDALATFFNGRSGSVTGRGNTLIGANEAKLQGSNAVSQNLENGMGNVTQFRMANQGPGAWGTLGQFVGAVTPTLFSQAAQNGTGFGFRKTPATPTITT